MFRPSKDRVTCVGPTLGNVDCMFGPTQDSVKTCVGPTQGNVNCYVGVSQSNVDYYAGITKDMFVCLLDRSKKVLRRYN